MKSLHFGIYFKLLLYPFVAMLKNMISYLHIKLIKAIIALFIQNYTSCRGLEAIYLSQGYIL